MTYVENHFNKNQRGHPLGSWCQTAKKTPHSVSMIKKHSDSFGLTPQVFVVGLLPRPEPNWTPTLEPEPNWTPLRLFAGRPAHQPAEGPWR